MLPLDNANRFTDHFARREILDRVGVPVFFGASAFDPRLELDAFVAELAAAGYHGIANFPTSIHYDGRFRRALEEAGLGYAREVELLRAAQRQGLATFGYAKSRKEIQQLLQTGVDILCLNFGWNAGGTRALAQAFTLEEAADRARRIFPRCGRRARRRSAWSRAGRSSARTTCTGCAGTRAPTAMSAARRWTACRWKSR